MRQDTRQHIIETASKLFYSKGYNLTGINEIIEEAEIAKATLYNHFKSKEDLCLAYLDYKNEGLLQKLDAFCSKRKEGKSRLMGVLEFLVPFFESKDFNGCWCIRTIAELPKENRKIKNKIRSQKEELLEFILELVKSNTKIRKEEGQRKLAKRIYLLYESAVSESHLQGELWPIIDCIEMLRDLLK